MEERRAQQSSTMAETCQASGKMGRKGPVAEGGETACSLLRSSFTRQHLLLNIYTTGTYLPPSLPLAS